MREVILSAFSESAAALASLMADAGALQKIESAGRLLANAFHHGGRVYSCGNGGSMCDAIHFAEELSGKFRLERGPLPAVAISDPGHLTCTANDYGYEAVFARFIEAQGRKGDMLVAISTSGKSPSIVAAAKQARALGLQVVALTGKPASPLAAHADIDICTPAGRYSDRVQELHIKVIHVLIELVERQLYPQNYAQ
jgi:D-sedoheptulose 7-phosphate isomerase